VPGRHDRRAALPSGGYARPASVDETGLLVTVYGESGGVEGVFDFTGLAGSVDLRQAMAAAFDRKSGPGGTWRAQATCVSAYKHACGFLKWLAGSDDPPRAVSDITPAVWIAWRMSVPATSAGRFCLTAMRALMREVPGLPAQTLKVVDRRIPVGPPPSEAAYSYQEYTRIRAAAATTFNSALARIRANREHLRRWHAGDFARGSGEWLIGEVLDCLVRTGDVPLYARRDGVRHVRKACRAALGGCGPEETWGRLNLSCTEAFAAAVLLVAGEGWNRSVVHRMRIPEHDPAAGDDADIYMVEISKRRRPVRLRYTTNNLLDAGPGSPGRLMSQVIEATELTRRSLDLQGQRTDRLLAWRRAHSPAGHDLFGTGLVKNMRECGVDEAGNPVAVSLRRLRRTVQVLVRKEPAQNSREVHESVYVLPDPATKEAANETIAQGLADAVEHARVIGKMRMVLGDDADQLVELSDDPELAKAIANGDYDTATGACSDFTNSPFTQRGSPCTASFLLCLACGNAVATRRHLPRLACCPLPPSSLAIRSSPSSGSSSSSQPWPRLSSTCAPRSGMPLRPVPPGLRLGDCTLRGAHTRRHPPAACGPEPKATRPRGTSPSPYSKCSQKRQRRRTRQNPQPHAAHNTARRRLGSAVPPGNPSCPGSLPGQGLRRAAKNGIQRQ
jgi:hypothetical protein